MMDISFTTWDITQMALIAGSPGFVAGLGAGALAWPARRLLGAVIGGAIGFALCLGAVALWVFELK